MTRDSQAADSQQPPATSRPIAALPGVAVDYQHPLLTVPEAAFLLRVGVRTVWRLMADPKSGFPKPRRIRGRTFLARDEVMAFLAHGGKR